MGKRLNQQAAALFFSVLGAAIPAAASNAPELPAATPGTVTYVDFWASWCAPCAQSFDWLNEMQARYGADGLRIVGVGVDENEQKAQRFLQAHPAKFNIVRDPEGKLAERYAVEGMPYAVILDASGKVLHRHTGYDPAQMAEYERSIAAALAAHRKVAAKP